MPKIAVTLTERSIEKLRGVGLHCVSPGLYLAIGPGGARSWIYRWNEGEKKRHKGLGPYRPNPANDPAHVSVARARDLVVDQVRARKAGIGPIAADRDAADKARLGAIMKRSFKAATQEYYDGNEVGWSVSHKTQWLNSLRDYAFPIIGDLSCSAINVAAVLAVVQPMWNSKNETASRLRGRIEVVLDFAKVRGWRAGENPAVWKGNLQHSLPAQKKVKTKEHHAALAYRDAPALVAELRDIGGASADALEFLILSATRRSETANAEWSEFDLTARTWTIPKERMKAGVEHSVPLTDRMVKILSAQKKLGDRVFNFGRDALAVLLKSLRPGVTLHGFRSSFRDWAGESGQPRELAEMALAHAVGSAVENSYARSRLLERRRAVMTAWQQWLDAGDSSVVVALTDRAAG
jgi:integrase